MNSLIENGYIKEMSCGTNLAYLLNDNSAFLPTEYKVLQNQTDSCFVKCMKLLYNGKVQLYYVTKNLKPFTSMLPYLDVDGFMTIATNIITDIIDVKHNGFLSCEKIDISFKHIYVDPATYKVSLIYLPLNKSAFEDTASFENEIRTCLIKVITGISELSSPKTTQFATDLANGTLKLEDLQNRLKGGNIPFVERRTFTKPANKPEKKSLRMIAMNAPSKFEMLVSKDEFLIGRNPATADGVISFNKMIGRTHCKISRQGDEYTITDLQSANGTFVNKVKLQPNRPCSIKNGDVIRLANSDFQVSII